MKFNDLTIWINLLFGIMLLVCSHLLFSQGVVIGGNDPDSSAMLHVISADKGVLLPRITFTDRNTIADPAEGLLVYCTDCGRDGAGLVCIFQGGEWLDMNLSCYEPFPPGEGMHIPSVTQIIWTWQKSHIALGYKWNTTNDYNTSSDLGMDTSKTETGLTCWTDYSRYIWAYNVCGHSVPVTLTGTTLSCCGTPFTITHTAGNVAPVTKTTTYGTIDSVPGEILKCWITQNLGADHQATAVDDATEASAGWYWQFNLQQGYKHDGTTRTPNTPWITGISENSDWIAANDPCAIELAGTWRMPTYTEWYNVDNTGGWNNWNHAWASALKLHAAGWISNTGIITQRGVAGYYWSTLQSDATHGWDLSIFSTNSAMYSHVKEDGFSLRCIRDE